MCALLSLPSKTSTAFLLPNDCALDYFYLSSISLHIESYFGFSFRYLMPVGYFVLFLCFHWCASILQI